MQCMQQGNKNSLEKHACLLLLLLLHAMRKAASDRQQSEMALFPLPSGGGDAAEKKQGLPFKLEFTCTHASVKQLFLHLF